MSLIKILLEDFNPNQKTIGGRTGMEKLRIDLDKIDPPDIDTHPKDKQEVLDILDIRSEPVQNSINNYLQHDYDFSRIEDIINMDKWYMDVFETEIDNKIAEHRFEEVLDLNYLKDFYEENTGKDPEQATADDYKEFLDNIEMDLDDWEHILDPDWYEEIMLELAKNEIEEDADDNISMLWDTVYDSVKVDGRDCIRCYRAIRVNFERDLTLRPEEGLGLYWSYEEEGASPYGASMSGEDVIVYALVPLSSVNWGETIYKNIWGLKHEKEVQLLSGYPIWIERIRVDQSGNTDPLKEKAELIAKTYFKKKWDKFNKWHQKRDFINTIMEYLRENNKTSDKFSITFDNYYKSKA